MKLDPPRPKKSPLIFDPITLEVVPALQNTTQLQFTGFFPTCSYLALQNFECVPKWGGGLYS